MALTNEEKRYLRTEIKSYIYYSVAKQEAKQDLMKEGFKSSTIDRYWRIFSDEEEL